MELEQAVIQYQLKKGMKETDKWMYLLIEKVRIPVQDHHLPSSMPVLDLFLSNLC